VKKLLLLVITLVLLAGAVIGCGGEIITYINDADTISIGVGEEFIIALDRDAGRGFTWTMEFDREFLKLTDESYDSQEKAEGLTGVGGTHYFQLKGVKAGSTEVNLVYNREREAAIDTKLFKITITE